MFDIGWTELLVVAVIAILVVGPRELPGMLRTFGRTLGNLRRMATEFQGQFNDALRDAERQAGLDEAKKTMSGLSDVNPMADLKDGLNPLKDIEKDLKAGLDTPAPSATAQTDTVSPASAPFVEEERKKAETEAAASIAEARDADTDKAASESRKTETS